MVKISVLKAIRMGLQSIGVGALASAYFFLNSAKNIISTMIFSVLIGGIFSAIMIFVSLAICEKEESVENISVQERREDVLKKGLIEALLLIALIVIVSLFLLGLFS